MSKIAIIGSGISGLTAGYLLSKKHDVTLFEANDYLGGHTATIDIEHQGEQHAVDTGFIVFNDRTYPNFLKLLDQIGVEKQETEMSFSVHHKRTGLEYNGHSLASLFAQKRNLLNPKFYFFLSEIMRFNRLAKKELSKQSVFAGSLGDFLSVHGFKGFFAEHYILPMVAAIWSSSLKGSMDFPFGFFLRFFNNHGLLNIVDRPQWYVLKGGSRSYVPHLSAAVADIRLNSPVLAIKRDEQQGKVIISSEYKGEQGEETFDEVILACHSDQALRMLSDATEDERKVLSQLQYQNNEVVLHTDTALLPKRKLAWASWNYRLDSDHNAPPAVTYNMNILQGLTSKHTFCVTLNQSEAIASEKVLRSFNYAHPVFNEASLIGQSQRELICGKNHTHFCGAYWYNGFHEDGVKSALDVCRRFNIEL